MSVEKKIEIYMSEFKRLLVENLHPEISPEKALSCKAAVGKKSND